MGRPRSRTPEHAASRPHGVGRRGKAAVAAALSAALAVTPLTIAQAAPLTSPVVSRDWEANERVAAIVDAGSVIYVGGRFTEFSDGVGSTVARKGLAAINPATGAPLSLNLPVNGDVRALELSSDGLTLYIGGEFTSIAGVARLNAAAISTATGAVTTWNPRPNRAVLAIETRGTTAFIGGGFTKVGTTDKLKIAATNGTTGAVITSFTARADKAVTDLELSPAGATLLVAGSFKYFNGSAAKFLARVSPSTGSRYAWETQPGVGLLSIAVEGANVYAGGRGSGGRLYSFDIATGRRNWWRGSDGDVQAIAVTGGVLYGGGHFQKFNGVDRQHAFALRASDATDLNWQVWTNGVLGIWALSASPERVVIGGDFTKVNYLSRTAHLARIT